MSSPVPPSNHTVAAYADPYELGFEFRPASQQDFAVYAKSIQTLLSLPLRKSQELLAQIYGFAGTYQLRTELKKYGMPGPFDDQSAPNESYAALNDRLERADRRAERAQELARIAWEPVAGDWSAQEIVKLASYLGLFETPRGHRKSTALVKKAVTLVREQGWSAEGVMRLLTLFEPSFEYDASNLSPDSFMTRLSPLDYLREQQDYRWPDIFLEFSQERDLSSLGAPDVSELADGMGPIDEWHTEGSLADMLACKNTWEAYVYGPLSRKYKVPHETSVAEADYEEIISFLANPDPYVAAKNSVLASIPNIVEIAKAWPALAAPALAQDRRSYRKEQVLLTHEVLDTADRTPLERPLHCFVLLNQADRDVGELENMSLWSYATTICEKERDSAVLRPVAGLTGMLMVPFKGDYCVDDETFMETLDAHSDTMNDVWKVLQYEYFEPHGYRSIEEFFDDRPYESIATVRDIEVIPSHRGQGRLSLYLDVFADTLANYPYSQFDVSWPVPPGYEVDDPAETEEFSLSAPTVFVFPVEGSLRSTRMNPFARKSRGKLPPAEHPDEKAEARKAKLTAHFKALDKSFKVDATNGTTTATVLVYDPFEYPAT